MTSRVLAVIFWATSLAGCGYFDFAPDPNAQNPIVADASGDAAPTDAGADAGNAGGSDAGSDAGTTPGGLADLCAYMAITVFDDGDPSDVAAGATLAAAIASGCATSPTVTTRLETDPGLLDPITHAPLLGPGNLGVVGGDDYYQDVMAYLEMGTTPLVPSQDANTWTISVRGGPVLVSRALATLDAGHDLMVIEISRDVPSGSVVLTAYGLYYQGTLAAAYYFAQSIAPTIGSDGRDWYVVEWTDADGGRTPDAADTFSVLAMGP